MFVQLNGGRVSPYGRTAPNKCGISVLRGRSGRFPCQRSREDQEYISDHLAILNRALLKPISTFSYVSRGQELSAQVLHLWGFNLQKMHGKHQPPITDRVARGIRGRARHCTNRATEHHAQRLLSGSVIWAHGAYPPAQAASYCSARRASAAASGSWTCALPML